MVSQLIKLEWHSISKHWEVRQNGSVIFQGKSKGVALNFAEQRVDLWESKGVEVIPVFDLRGGE